MSGKPHTSLTTLAWLAVGVAVCLVAGELIMGVAMATLMNGGMHHGNAGPQTPVFATAGEVFVEIRDFDYSPRDLTINVGGAVTWVN
jgi:hypothetical protein